MLVKEGVIQKMFIEPEKSGDPMRCRTQIHAELHKSQGEEARSGGDSHARRLRLLREGKVLLRISAMIRRGAARP